MYYEKWNTLNASRFRSGKNQGENTCSPQPVQPSTLQLSRYNLDTPVEQRSVSAEIYKKIGEESAIPRSTAMTNVLRRWELPLLRTLRIDKRVGVEEGNSSRRKKEGREEKSRPGNVP